MLKGWNWKTRTQCLWQQDPRTWVEGEQTNALSKSLVGFSCKKCGKRKGKSEIQNWPLLAKI